MKNNIVFPSKGNWAVKKEGDENIKSVHESKLDAVKTAYKLAEKEGTDVIIINKDGKIENLNAHQIENFLRNKRINKIKPAEK